MINNEILSFIKDQLAHGATKDKVKDMLIAEGGWDDKDVEEAFETINFSGTSYPSVLRNAEALEIKNEGKSNPPSSFAPEPAKTVSGNAPSTVFFPGSSHIEQPKIMEPSTLGSDLRARIASGVSEKVGSPPVSVSRPAIQAVIAEPAISPSYPPPFIADQGTSPPVSVAPAIPATVSRNNELPQQFSPLPSMGQGVSSLLPSLNKTSVSPAVFSPATRAFTPSPQPTAVFPKSMIGNIHASPSASAKFAAMQQGQKPRGRFLFGLLMFFMGLAIGGISMNAYMKGYLKTDALDGIVEKGMNLIGLGTVTAPIPETPSVPATTKTTDAGDTGS